MARAADRVFEAAAERFGLLAAPTRLRIVCALVPGERNVGSLVQAAGASPSSLSQHLAVLYRCGVLARRRSGAQVFYRLAGERVALLREALCEQRCGATRCAPARG